MQGTLCRAILFWEKSQGAGCDSDKQSIYERLTAAVNEARCYTGNIGVLREIAEDLGFIARQGWGVLDIASNTRPKISALWGALDRMLSWESQQGRRKRSVENIEGVRLCLASGSAVSSASAPRQSGYCITSAGCKAAYFRPGGGFEIEPTRTQPFCAGK
jgi:hypothetical protein